MISIQAGIPAPAGVADGSCQPEEPTDETQQLVVYGRPLGQKIQVDLAELSAGEGRDDGIRSVAEGGQQGEPSVSTEINVRLKRTATETTAAMKTGHHI